MKIQELYERSIKIWTAMDELEKMWKLGYST